MAEMATRTSLFLGNSEIDQLFQIFYVFDTPNENVWPPLSKIKDYKSRILLCKPKYCQKCLVFLL